MRHNKNTPISLCGILSAVQTGETLIEMRWCKVSSWYFGVHCKLDFAPKTDVSAAHDFVNKSNNRKMLKNINKQD